MKVLLAVPRTEHQRIFELVSSKFDVKYMWTGYFKSNNLFYILAGLYYYRLRGYKIIHLHWLNYYYLERSLMRSLMNGLKFIFCLAFAKLIGVRIVWTCYNLYPHENVHPGLSRFMRRLFVRLCDSILVLHESMVPQIRENYNYRGKIECFNLGDYRILYPVKGLDRNEARGALDIPENSDVIINLGHIRRYKNLEILIKAFLNSRLEKEHDLRLVIGGKVFEDAYANEIQALAQGHSEILLHLEYIPDEKMEEYMIASDIMIVLQEMRGVSGNLYLAASYGIPILTTERSGATAELVKEHGLGEVCEFGAEQVGMTIDSLLDDKDRLNRYTENEKVFIASNSWEKSAAVHIRVYKKLLKR